MSPLPPLNRFVLIHLADEGWRYEEDREGVCFDVACRVECRVGGNDLLPYAWKTFGPARYFGHEVDAWWELPR